ncbi:MAG: UDP-N-acetylmuramoyl-L-alanine--D-glutamate ligase [Clostridia bacterium]|nr:UDP-N-acetylmuramoyl-L-alanine--D-glutamate ligase [Clostridia bacterium]
MSRASERFFEYIKDKKITVIGAGISNSPLVKYFTEHGCASVEVRDKKVLDQSTVNDFEKLGAKVICGEKYLEDIRADLVIRTPGLRPDVKGLAEAKERGAEVIGETQFFLKFCPCRVWGVTGSDGKTTTTTLVSKLLESTGRKVFLGGNIGTPLLPLIDNISETDAACLELSSFQLMDAEFSPDVSIVTNISQNHLDWHRDMDEYVSAKTNIVRHQEKNGIAVLNADDPKNSVFEASSPGKVRFFSLEKEIENGTCLKDGVLFAFEKPLFAADNIKIPGKFNVANYLAAICAVYDEVDTANVIKLARTFGGVEHRCEWIRNLEGVDYYNSSIDSSPARTLATLSAFKKKLTIICGGYDKNLDYSVLREPFERCVKKVYVTGQTAPKILAALQGDNTPYTLSSCPDLRAALIAAKSESQPGDTVVLSPASASFDSFKNFEERGNYFKQMVKNL